MIRENIFIVFLPRGSNPETVQRIEKAVTNVNVFMQDFYSLSTFAPFGDGITAAFFVKDGADLGLYCYVKIDTSKLTQEDKDKIFNLLNAKSTNNINDWKKYFIDNLIVHGRNLCETDYPCRLFRKVQALCPELLEETYKLHTSIKNQEKANDSTDPTPFSVYECAYGVLVNNFYQNKTFIEHLLTIPTSTQVSIPASNVSTNTSRNPMWATIATEERIALIIFFLFVRPGDDLFLCHNQIQQNTQHNAQNESELTEALSRFKDALSSWL